MLGSMPVTGAVVTLSGAAAGSGSTGANGAAIIMNGDSRVSITDALFIAHVAAGIPT
jgi:hypothetical protein